MCIPQNEKALVICKLLKRQYESGLFTFETKEWIPTWAQGARAGKPMGSIEVKPSGHSSIRVQRYINGKLMRIGANRLIYYIVNGTLPDAIIEHVDENSMNNNPSNLRPATASQNSMRVGKRAKNAFSKYKGVLKGTRGGKYRAMITYGGVQKFLGYFDCEVDAAEAYNSAAIKHHGDYAHLNDIDVSSRLSESEKTFSASMRSKRGSSRFRGVQQNAGNGHKWRSRVTIDGKRIFCGYFDDEGLAAKAHDIALIKHGGDLLKLNFPF